MRPRIADTILFASAVQGQTIVLAGSQLTVNSDVTIDGGSGVTLNADGKSRVLLVQDATPDNANEVTLAHLAITGGRTTGEYDAGGGIRVGLYAALTLDHVIVSNNATSGAYGEGGGIAAPGSYSSVTLLDSSVIGNSTTGDRAKGGGIYGYSVVLTNSTVSGNGTGGDHAGGGGIYGYYVALTNSTTTDNSTAGIYAGGGGIAGADFSSMSLTNSSVSGNSTLGSQAGGGGIAGDFVALTNSTINANSTAGGAGGGGISVGDYGAATIANSIVADNSAPGSTAPDLAGTIGDSNGHNIFGSDVEGNAPGDLENVPASLLFAGGLADNGGPTQTVALRDAADNPALGGADPTSAPATDQRGVARPQPAGTNPDIGAFELDQSANARAIDGTAGDDVLRGTAGAELIRGRAGADRLWGLAGDDQLFGGYGSDVLVGGPGLDRMTGGAGADRFVLRQPEAAPATGPAMTRSSTSRGYRRI